MPKILGAILKTSYNQLMIKIIDAQAWMLKQFLNTRTSIHKYYYDHLTIKIMKHKKYKFTVCPNTWSYSQNFL